MASGFNDDFEDVLDEYLSINDERYRFLGNHEEQDLSDPHMAASYSTESLILGDVWSVSAVPDTLISAPSPLEETTPNYSTILPSTEDTHMPPDASYFVADSDVSGIADFNFQDPVYDSAMIMEENTSNPIERAQQPPPLPLGLRDTSPLRDLSWENAQPYAHEDIPNNSAESMSLLQKKEEEDGLHRTGLQAERGMGQDCTGSLAADGQSWDYDLGRFANAQGPIIVCPHCGSFFAEESVLK
ncbi:MAG: hypothetical protein M1820_004036 [Bogoriella megaspora]|nr:MAG: hypothetical protein M1820_004036 [Bogoriella megaspora]